MTRFALYLVCVAGLAVIGTRAVQWNSDEARAQAYSSDSKLTLSQRLQLEWCLKHGGIRPDVPPKIEEPAEEDEEKSPIVKAILKVLDEFDGDEGEGNTDETRDLMRRILREADPELDRSLGKNSLRLIAEANAKPKELMLYIRCENDEDRSTERGKAESDPEIEPREGIRDTLGEPRCPNHITARYLGTVDNPITLEEALRLREKRCEKPRTKPAESPDEESEPDESGSPAGEDPFGAE